MCKAINPPNAEIAYIVKSDSIDISKLSYETRLVKNENRATAA